MKKGLSLILSVVCFISASMPVLAVDTPTAEKCILIHADTGTVLYEKNADERSLIASTTKIMTALVALENCDVYESVIIRPEWTGIEGSSMYLKAGESYTVGELLYGLMLVSGNDAATALAGHISGSPEGFAALMNEKALQLGLENTSFKNPHGLDEEGHYSTARDMALIMSAAMENEDFVKISSARSRNVGELTHVNHNKLLWRYDGCISGKTGYTMASGRSLVSCAERDGLRLICVTLSDPDDWNTHMGLYDWAFENYSYESLRLLQPEIAVPLISGFADSIKVGCIAPNKVLLPKNEDYKITIELPAFVYASIEYGEVIGAVTASIDGVELGRTPLCALENAQRDDTLKLTPWERFRLSWYGSNRLGIYCPAFGSAI